MSPLALVARLALLSQLALLACGDGAGLHLTPRHLAIGHDGDEVLDACLIDLQGDGRPEILVSTTEALRVIELRDGAVRDLSTGTGLDGLAPGHTLHATPDGALLERDDGAVLLRLSDIGTFSEERATPPRAKPDLRLAQELDLDADGDLDRARLEGRTLLLELTLADGSGLDVSRQLGAAGLRLPGEPRRLLAGDVDGDGDADLLVVGGRLFALVNNGAPLRLDDAQRRAAAKAAIAARGESRATPDAAAAGSGGCCNR